jgi:hypothetical protein
MQLSWFTWRISWRNRPLPRNRIMLPHMGTLNTLVYRCAVDHIRMSNTLIMCFCEQELPLTVRRCWINGMSRQELQQVSPKTLDRSRPSRPLCVMLSFKFIVTCITCDWQCVAAFSAGFHLFQDVLYTSILVNCYLWCSSKIRITLYLRNQLHSFLWNFASKAFRHIP